MDTDQRSVVTKKQQIVHVRNDPGSFRPGQAAPDERAMCSESGKDVQGAQCFAT
jgi:hypothetical protein